jgi:hypothetical protein
MNELINHFHSVDLNANDGGVQKRGSIGTPEEDKGKSCAC